MPRTAKTRALNFYTKMNPKKLDLKKKKMKMIVYKQLKMCEKKTDTSAKCKCG